MGHILFLLFYIYFLLMYTLGLLQLFIFLMIYTCDLEGTLIE